MSATTANPRDQKMAKIVSTWEKARADQIASHKRMVQRIARRKYPFAEWQVKVAIAWLRVTGQPDFADFLQKRIGWW